ncbi:hypothetical protein [Megamonas hypermegale]|uniref:hypothetical protein n=1 Tax=Megamonas hypermegale TaxID=158847 RepID=UPI0026E9E4BB|nr:hypothetical protein [Megamonas hypermegale]
MFTKTDFWIGLAVGVVAGAFGYKFIQSRAQQAQPAIAEGQAEVSMAELVRQKEELEDMIAAQQAQAAK